MPILDSRFSISDSRSQLPSAGSRSRLVQNGRRQARVEGFTLIEMLVVIVILGILMSLAIVGVTAALRTAKVSKTEALIEALAMGAEQYRGRWGDYPPSTLAELKVGVPNEVNNGIESLTACLASRTKGDPLLNMRDDQLINADNDRASKNVTNWYFGGYELWEVSDAFGYAMVYMHWKDYDKANPGTRRIRTDPSSAEMMFEPLKSPTTKTYLRPTKNQILSVGQDGKPGTADDVPAR